MRLLNTKRLRLRQWQEDDVEELYLLATKTDVKKAGWHPHESREQSLKLINHWKNDEEIWAVALKDLNKAIGYISLSDIRRHDSYREVEFVISSQYKNNGYATEAVKRILKYAFDELNLLAVAVCHYPDNLTSRRVIEKCGFMYEGTLRRYSKNQSDSIRYSIIREEWEAICSQKNDYT